MWHLASGSPCLSTLPTWAVTAGPRHRGSLEVCGRFQPSAGQAFTAARQGPWPVKEDRAAGLRPSRSRACPLPTGPTVRMRLSTRRSINEALGSSALA